jgi:hypothetical protein
MREDAISFFRGNVRICVVECANYASIVSVCSKISRLFWNSFEWNLKKMPYRLSQGILNILPLRVFYYYLL